MIFTQKSNNFGFKRKFWKFLGIQPISISRNFFEFVSNKMHSDWLILEMRFELCGGIEVPNWIVFQLTKISKENDIEKIKEISRTATTLMKNDQKDIADESRKYFEENAEGISVILYLYESMNRFNITEDQFQRQLQLFGLAPEIVDVLVENSRLLESKGASNIRVMN